MRETIKMTLGQKLSELNYDTNTIVQRYIEKPLLIGGYKFDLRLYVCVPSYQPLVIYMYKEGLARFGTDKFSLNDLKNPFRHLTNSSINKLGPGYAEMKDRVGSGEYRNLIFNNLLQNSYFELLTQVMEFKIIIR